MNRCLVSFKRGTCLASLGPGAAILAFVLITLSACAGTPDEAEPTRRSGSESAISAVRVWCQSSFADQRISALGEASEVIIGSGWYRVNVSDSAFYVYADGEVEIYGTPGLDAMACTGFISDGCARAIVGQDNPFSESYNQDPFGFGGPCLQ